MDDLKIPYVSKELVEYIEKQFGIDYLMCVKSSNNDEHLGFIRGVREIVTNMRYLHENQLEREV